MTLDSLLQAFQDHLEPIIAAASGRLTVADTELDAFDMLNVTADHFRVVLCPSGGDSLEGGDDAGGYAAETLSFFLQVPKPGVINASKGLHRNVTGRGINFMARLGWLSKQVRAITIDSAEVDRECGRTLRFKDWDWVRVDGLPATIRAARLRFEIRYIMDAPDAESATLTTTGNLTLAISGNYLLVTSADGLTTKRVRLLDL